MTVASVSALAEAARVDFAWLATGRGTPDGQGAVDADRDAAIALLAEEPGVDDRVLAKRPSAPWARRRGVGGRSAAVWAGRERHASSVAPSRHERQTQKSTRRLTTRVGATTPVGMRATNATNALDLAAARADVRRLRTLLAALGDANSATCDRVAALERAIAFFASALRASRRECARLRRDVEGRPSGVRVAS